MEVYGLHSRIGEPPHCLKVAGMAEPLFELVDAAIVLKRWVKILDLDYA